MPLKIHVSERLGAGGRLAQVVQVVGELDNTTYRDAERALQPVVAAPFPNVVFDLAGLTFLSSAGVAVLLNARRKLEAGKIAVAAVGMRPAIQKVFDIMRMLPAATVFGSAKEMDEYLAEIQKRADGD